MNTTIINKEGNLTTLRLMVEGFHYDVIVTKEMKLWGVPVNAQSKNTGQPDIYDILHNDDSPFVMQHKPNSYNHSDYYLKLEHRP